MVGKASTVTVINNHRLAVLSNLGCIPCLIDGWSEPGEIHHVLNGQYRHADEHRHTYSVCPWHHRGVPPVDLYFDYGPSMATNSREYHARYGSEAELIQIADAFVRIVDQATRRCEWLPDRKLFKLARALYKEIVEHIPPDRFQIA